jgi:hypothetical protein
MFPDGRVGNFTSATTKTNVSKNCLMRNVEVNGTAAQSYSDGRLIHSHQWCKDDIPNNTMLLKSYPVRLKICL